MADNKSGASHELGNLFVDIGSSGLGTLLKGLNSLSATFMLTKNAAQQFTKPIMDMSKNAGQGLVGLQKINAVTGLTIEQLQELQLWAKANSVDFGNYISQISNFQQNLLDIAFGRGNVSGLTILGLNPHDMDYRKPIEALEKIKKRVLEVDEATGAWALKELGLNAELLYQWKRKEVQINKNLILNKQEQQSISDQNDAWQKLGATWEAATTKLIAKLPIIATWLNKISDKIAQMPSLADKLKTNLEDDKLAEKAGATYIDKVAKLMNDFQLNEIDKKIEKSKRNKKEFAELGLKTSNKKLKLKYLQQAEYEAKRIEALQKLRKEYEPKTNKSLYELHQERVAKDPNKKNKIEVSLKDSNNKDILKGATKDIKTNGALISSQPINDAPINISDNENTLPPVPQAALSQNIMTNNITVTQNITGDNAVEIASRARDGMSDWFSNYTNTMERDLSHGL